MENIAIGFIVISLMRHIKVISNNGFGAESLAGFVLHIPVLWIIGWIINIFI